MTCVIIPAARLFRQQVCDGVFFGESRDRGCIDGGIIKGRSGRQGAIVTPVERWPLASGRCAADKITESAVISILISMLLSRSSFVSRWGPLPSFEETNDENRSQECHNGINPTRLH